MNLTDTAINLVNALIDKQLTISTAESCTGGMLGQYITDISGSSATYMGGVITYNNKLKQQLLGVEGDTLKQYGAVSAQTASQMVQGLLNNFNTNIAIATTGIAGPTGGNDAKPVGLVYICIAIKNNITIHKNIFTGNRQDIRQAATKKAFELVLQEL